MSKKNSGVTPDPLFLALTRPATVMGVTYTAFCLNVGITFFVFFIKKNLFYLPIFIPIQILFYTLSQNDPRIFDLFFIWIRTKGTNILTAAGRYWKASSYSSNVITIGKRHKK